MNAFALDDIVEFLVLGGPVVWILVAFSHAVLAIAMGKLWQFARAGMFGARGPQRVTLALGQYRQAGADAAIVALEGERSPAGMMLHQALLLLRQGKLGEQRLQDELSRLAQTQLNELRRFLRPLDVMANAATLLGLFGTVLGMITAFQELQSAGSQVDPARLSGGIWVALLTTAVGLAVAIPATILYNWLDGIVEGSAARMQDSVAQLFTLEAERRSADVVAFGAPHAVKAHAASA